MLHGKLTTVPLSVAEPSVKLDVICTPSLLQSKGADTMINAILKRLPVKLSFLARKHRGLILVLMTDAAKPCDRLTRLLPKLAPATCPIVVLHAHCCMHQVSLGVGAVHKPLGVLGPLFCATNLSHKGNTWDLLRTTVHRTIRERLLITLTPPDPEHTAYMSAVLGLLEWDTDMLSDRNLQRMSRQKHRRKAAADLLARLLHGIGGLLFHYCPLGCCLGGEHESPRDESVRKIIEAFDDLFFAAMVPVPACNRWTKLYPAVSFWLCTMLVYGLISSAWVAIHSRRSIGSGAVAEGLVVDELVGPASDDIWRAVDRSRLSKSIRLLTDPDSPDRLAALAITLRPCNMFMGYLFRTGALTSDVSILELLDPETNPVLKLLAFYWEKLTQPDDAFWLPLRGLEGWSEHKLFLVMSTVMTMYGTLDMRLVRQFKGWPFKMWKLAKLTVPVEVRTSFYDNELTKVRRCCKTPFVEYFQDVGV